MTENQPNSQFLHHLKEVVEIAKSNETQVVVVGGIALRATMKKDVQSVRPNGTTPDVDMIGLGPNIQNIKNTKKEIRLYCRANPDCPSVDLEPVTFADTHERHSLLEGISSLRKNSNGSYFLTFRGIDQPIDAKTMEVVTLNYGGVEFPSLPPLTLLHRYKTRVGVLKPKDVQKINEFKEYIKSNGGADLDSSLYLSYIEFCQRMHQEYPRVVNFVKWYWDFDYKHDGKISGAKGPIYKLTDLFHH